ncbi:MAG: sigma-54-dependent Fis family transcriptional regulator [Deltaproteobacteria bacterium]|nr:sigma-54-dependent Fis family transcriptional regulator [Deltaproteobacteria bacterium]
MSAGVDNRTGPPGQIVVVDDEKLIRWSIKERLEQRGHEVAALPSGEDCVAWLAEHDADLILLDVRLPGIDGMAVLRKVRAMNRDLPVILLTAHGTVPMAVEAMRLGAVDFLLKPFDLDLLELAVSRTLEAARLRREVSGLMVERTNDRRFAAIVGKSPEVARLREVVEKIARSDASTVLIRGESGSGKEVVARAIHLRSRRAEKPFMAVNCTAIPEALVESELFGHERGAFTDAKAQKKGLFELAAGGTVLLDEIGDMPLSAQAKLLRLLEDKTFKRVGGTMDLRAEVRAIASTHRDLERLVADGRFRQDLYFRLNVISIDVAPLRDRLDDVPLLAAHFIAQFNAELGSRIEGIAPEALTAMHRYSWPGNVRELKNLVERAFILVSGPVIELEHLPPDLLGRRATPITEGAPAPALDLPSAEKRFIEEALAKTHGNQTRAAELLGVTRDTLRYRMKKHDLL